MQRYSTVEVTVSKLTTGLKVVKTNARDSQKVFIAYGRGNLYRRCFNLQESCGLSGAASKLGGDFSAQDFLYSVNGIIGAVVLEFKGQACLDAFFYGQGYLRSSRYRTLAVNEHSASNSALHQRHLSWAMEEKGGFNLGRPFGGLRILCGLLPLGFLALLVIFVVCFLLAGLFSYFSRRGVFTSTDRLVLWIFDVSCFEVASGPSRLPASSQRRTTLALQGKRVARQEGQEKDSGDTLGLNEYSLQ